MEFRSLRLISIENLIQIKMNPRTMQILLQSVFQNSRTPHQIETDADAQWKATFSKIIFGFENIQGTGSRLFIFDPPFLGGMNCYTLVIFFCHNISTFDGGVLSLQTDIASTLLSCQKIMILLIKTMVGSISDRPIWLNNIN